MVGQDPRVTATAPVQPYIGFDSHDLGSHAQQKGPMFLMSGGEDTIAPIDPNQTTVFADANVPVFWGTLETATHLGDPYGDMGRYRGPITAWFRYHLLGDATARGVFYGASCALCVNDEWTVDTKSWPIE
jgi:hypothetical protein